MPNFVQCQCHEPARNLIMFPQLVQVNGEAVVATCPFSNPPILYINEDNSWKKKDGWRIENLQVIKADGSVWELPQASSVPDLPSERENRETEVRPGGRKPAQGTRVDLSRDDYY